MDTRQFPIKPVISHIAMMGDSLSDRGTLDHRRLFKIIPMSWLAGLSTKSPKGRFTNGYAWSDHLSAKLENEFLIQSSEHKHHAGEYKEDPSDIAEDIITKRRTEKTLQHSYTLNNDLFVPYRGKDFVRNYDEGGLTSHDYSWKPSTSITRFFSRIILSTLSEKRQALLKYDKELEITNEQKKQTLLIEWSGANDLITVNAKPSLLEADKAIQDRITNAEKLIRHGYHHFILMNMPDLSLCPRFQIQSTQKQEDTRSVVNYFNKKLKEACEALQKKHPSSSIEVFDVNQIFTNIYEDALNGTNLYPCHFEKSKLHTPYVGSKDFTDSRGLSPAKGYMFWDDIHPSSDMHAMLAEKFYEHYVKKFQFVAPKSDTAEELCKAFGKKYKELFQQDTLGLFGGFRESNLPTINYAEPTHALTTILKHALIEGGQRTKKAITELRWIDSKGNLNTNIPALKEIQLEFEGISKFAKN